MDITFEKFPTLSGLPGLWKSSSGLRGDIPHVELHWGPIENHRKNRVWNLRGSGGPFFNDSLKNCESYKCHFPKNRNVSILMMSRVNGKVMDLLKPSFLTLEPPNYAKQTEEHTKSTFVNFISEYETVKIVTFAKGECRKDIEIRLINSRST